jgi:hypothetical protein
MAPRTVVEYPFFGEPTRFEARIWGMDECTWPLPESERNIRPSEIWGTNHWATNQFSFEIDETERMDIENPYKVTILERIRNFFRPCH